jgi:hypothetical protein
MQTGQEIEAALEEILRAEQCLWVTLVTLLEKGGALKSAEFYSLLEGWLFDVKKRWPDHKLGDRRYDTALLQTIVDALKGAPKPPAPPAWKPTTIEGGKAAD